MRPVFVAAAAVLISVLALSSAAVAVQNAVLYGTVYDSNAKPMAGVGVLPENQALSVRRVTLTSPDGSCTIAEVQPAEGYKVTASVGGKKIDAREGIVVNIGDERVIVPPLREQVLGTRNDIIPKVVEKGVTTERVSSAMSAVITGD